MRIHTDGEPDESHVKSKRDPKAKMSTRIYPHMEKGYTNTRRKRNGNPKQNNRKTTHMHMQDRSTTRRRRRH